MYPRTLRRTQNAGATGERMDTIGLVPGKLGPHVGNKLNRCLLHSPPFSPSKYKSKPKASRDDVEGLLVMRKRNRD